MENSSICKQLDPNARPSPLRDLCSQRNEKRLNITPLGASRYRASKEQIQCALVLSLHQRMILLFSVFFNGLRTLQIQRQQAFKDFFIGHVG